MCTHNNIIHMAVCFHFLYNTCICIGAIFVTSFIGGTGSIFLDDVDCIGNESRLIDCSHNSLGMHDCTHADDAGVHCLQLSKSEQLCPSFTMSNLTWF